MKATVVVNSLLETDEQSVQAARRLQLRVGARNDTVNPDDPALNIERFAQAIGMQYDEHDKQVLRRFKQAVKGYIRWVNDDTGQTTDPADLKQLNQAKTFAEAEAILAKYSGEPTFLYMVRSGYFV